jgi:hypothetical protein
LSPYRLLIIYLSLSYSHLVRNIVCSAVEAASLHNLKVSRIYKIIFRFVHLKKLSSVSIFPWRHVISIVLSFLGHLKNPDEKEQCFNRGMS